MGKQDSWTPATREQILRRCEALELDNPTPTSMAWEKALLAYINQQIGGGLPAVQAEGPRIRELELRLEESREVARSRIIELQASEAGARRAYEEEHALVLRLNAELTAAMQRNNDLAEVFLAKARSAGMASIRQRVTKERLALQQTLEIGTHELCEVLDRFDRMAARVDELTRFKESKLLSSKEPSSEPLEGRTAELSPGS